MNIQYLVIPIEYAIKFYRLQVPQQTHFIYVLDKREWKLREYTYLDLMPPNVEWYAAYTSDEIETLLPAFIIYEKVTKKRVGCLYSATKDCIKYADPPQSVLVAACDSNPVVRRAKMLISLIENNLLTL